MMHPDECGWWLCITGMRTSGVYFVSGSSWTKKPGTVYWHAGVGFLTCPNYLHENIEPLTSYSRLLMWSESVFENSNVAEQSEQ